MRNFKMIQLTQFHLQLLEQHTPMGQRMERRMQRRMGKRRKGRQRCTQVEMRRNRLAEQQMLMLQPKLRRGQPIRTKNRIMFKIN